MRNLATLTRRALPRGARDGLGARWRGVFGLLARAAVVTNAGLVVFTLDLFGGWGLGLTAQLWVFVALQCVAREPPAPRAPRRPVASPSLGEEASPPPAPLRSLPLPPPPTPALPPARARSRPL